jgi:hypothetical protein
MWLTTFRTWNKVGSAAVKIAPPEAGAALRRGSPSVVVSTGERTGALSLNSFMLQPGEENILADKLYEVLKAHSA